MLKIKNITVKVLEKVILNDFSLEIKPGEIHVLMGTNGAGKSTIGKVLMRDLDYEIVKGDITYKEESILDKTTTEVARLGFFMVSQNPVEIAGVSNAEMLRMALMDRGLDNFNVLKFNQQMVELCQKLEISKDFVHRDINYNMSGGEKKKNELLHLWMLKPSFIILDEIDSGLDVDALKLVASSIREYYVENKPSILVITHQKSLVEMIKPDYVHVLKDGKMVNSGDFRLAEKIFKEGFFGASEMTESDKNE